MTKYNIFPLIVCIFLLVVIPFGAQAQDKTPPSNVIKPSPVSVNFARDYAKNCLGEWSNAECLKTVSGSNIVLTGQYMDVLKEQGKTDKVAELRDGCAASTAAFNKSDIPAKAMRNAYVQCANTISDISEATTIKPDLSHYQLLLGAIMCLDGSDVCKKLEAQLSPLKG